MDRKNMSNTQKKGMENVAVKAATVTVIGLVFLIGIMMLMPIGLAEEIVITQENREITFEIELEETTYIGQEKGTLPTYVSVKATEVEYDLTDAEVEEATTTQLALVLASILMLGCVTISFIYIYIQKKKSTILMNGFIKSDKTRRGMVVMGLILGVVFIGLIQIIGHTSATPPIEGKTISFGNNYNIGVAGDVVYDVEVGDLDNDGDMDIISADKGRNVYVWENDGTPWGDWTEKDIGNVGQYVLSIDIGDLDNDGYLDIVSGDADNHIYVWQNDGTPFDNDDWNKNWVGDGDKVQSVKLGDLDNDGSLDIVSGDHEKPYAKIYVWQNDETPFIDPWTKNYVGNPGQWCVVRGVDVGDLDNDGDLDIVSSDEGKNVYAWENDGTPFNNEWLKNLIGKGIGNYMTCVEIGDLDKDGWLDVVSGDSEDNIFVWKNDGTPFSNQWYKKQIGEAGFYIREIAIGDLNNDGRLDIVSGDKERNVYVWENDGAPFDVFWSHTDIGVVIDEVYTVITGDLDNDGDLDIGLGDKGKNIYVWKNTLVHRNMPFDNGIDIGDAGDEVNDVEVGDLDNDGDLDIISVDKSKNIYVWENDGTPWDTCTWTGIDVGDAGGIATSVDLGDFDNDGYLDIVTGDRTNNVYVWQNDGTPFNGNWNKNSVGTASKVTCVAICDLDDDGDLDIIIGDHDGKSVYVFENDETPFKDDWKRNKVGTAEWVVRQVAIGDLDNDGDLDIVSVDEEEKIYGWENDGSPFNDEWKKKDIGTTGGVAADSVVIVDLDNDGDLDIVTGDIGNNPNYIGNVYIWENDGTPWEPWIGTDIGNAAGYVTRVITYDIDNDGDKDIISSDYDYSGRDEGNIFIWENDGTPFTGKWNHYDIEDIDNGISDISIGDLDNDGDFDLITGDYGKNIYVWKNIGGSLNITTTSTAPSKMQNSEKNDILKIEVTHNGISSDNDIELNYWKFKFKNENGTPLTTAQAKALFENLYIYLDTGNDEWESGDTEVLKITNSNISLNNGYQYFTFEDGDTNVKIQHGTPNTYFLVAKIIYNATPQTPSYFNVTFNPDEDSVVEDRTENTSVSIQDTIPILTENIEVIKPDLSISSDDIQFSNQNPTVGETITINAVIHCSDSKEETSLEANWHFDKGEGDKAEDSSGNNNDGTIYGASWDEGIDGNSLEFDGVNDYVEISECSISDNSELTIEAWIYPTEFGGGNDGYRQILSKGDSGDNDRNFILLLEEDKLRFAIYNPKTNPNPPYVVTGNTSLTLNSWCHVAAVFKGGEYLKVFLNGFEDGEYTTSVIDNYDGSNVGIRIGAWKAGSNYIEHFEGKIDDVAIYSRAFSEEEIEANYLKYSWKLGTIGYWSLNKGEDSIVYDSSGNDNHGSKYGATWIDGKYGNALEFDGNNDYVKIPHNNSLNFGNGDFSVECWINTSQTSGSERAILLMKGESIDTYRWVLKLQIHGPNSGKAGIGMDSGGNSAQVFSTNIVNDGNWHHIAGVRDGNTLRIYIDGIEDNNIDCSSVGSVDNNNPLYFSRYAGTNYFDGIIDEVAIYNRALKENEIKAHNEVRIPLNVKVSYYDGYPYGGLNWTKESGIRLDKGSSSADIRDAYLPNVIKLPNGTYRMYYTGADNGGFWRILSAFSEDGNAWTKEDGIRIDCTPEYDSRDAFTPKVIQLSNGNFRMYYSSYQVDYYRILSAISSDGISWTNEDGIRLSNDNPRDPEVIELENGSYRMYYTGRNAKIYSAFSLGGLNWEKEEGIRLEPGGLYDSFELGYCDVVRLYNNSYRMYYTGYDSNRLRILSAISSDGLIWTRESGIRVDGGGIYDKHSAHPELVELENGSYRMFYSGYDGSNFRILSALSNDCGDLIDTQNISIFSGENTITSVQWTPTTPGDHDIYVLVDPENEIEESNENNNIARKTINVKPLINLFISSEDISFSNNNPEDGEVITIETKVHNIGSDNAHNIIVEFYDANNYIGQQTISFISHDSYSFTSIQWMAEPDGIHLIKVIAYGEGTNTAEATRSILVGQLVVGGIDATISTNPNPCYIGDLVKVYGNAIYDTTYGSGSPVAGADVTVIVQGEPGEWTSHTDRNGNYALWITAPYYPGIYTIEVEITDYTFSEVVTTLLEVKEYVVVEGPDLVVQSFSFSTDKPIIGDGVVLSAIIKNIGTESTSDILVRFYDRGVKIDDRIINQLDIDQSVEVTIIWNSVLPIGWHTMKVMVDPDGDISEYNENNNQRTKNLYVYPTLPDLTIVDISFSDNTPCVNQEIIISALIRNIGGVEAIDVLVEFFDDENLIGNEIISVPRKGGSIWVQIEYIFNNAGWHEIKVIVDPNNDIPENDENNNYYYESILVHDPMPDLIISSIYFSNSYPIEGEEITIYAIVTNSGEEDASNFLVDFLDNNVVIHTIQIIFLQHGSSTQISIPWIAIPGGWHTISVNADPNDLVTEINENNNGKSISIYVRIPHIPQPDLRIYSDDIGFEPLNPDPNDVVTIWATIENVGEGEALNVTVSFLIDEVIYKTKEYSSIPPYGEITYIIEWTAENIGSHVIRVIAYPSSKDPPDINPDDNEASRGIIVGNNPPVANVGGHYEGFEGTQIIFDASASSDPDENPLEYRWDINGDGSWDTDWSLDPTTTYTWGDDYSGIVIVEVTDGQYWVTDETTVNINNVDPIVEAGNNIFDNEGERIYFSGSFTDPGWLDTHTIEWDLDDDGVFETTGTLTPFYAYSDNGVYTVNLTVTDDDGGIGFDTLTVIVLDISPTADFTWYPEPQDEGYPVQFTDESYSYPDDIIGWYWDFGGLETSTEQNPEFTFMDDGIYEVTLIVTDDDESTDIITYEITILDIDPIADFIWFPEPQDEGYPIQFTDDSYSYPDDVIGWYWDLGDDFTSNEQNPNHPYGDNGLYIVTLTVFDDDFGISSISHTVIIENVPPSVEAGVDIVTDEDETIYFSGSYTDPGWLDTHTIEWDFGDGTIVTGTLTPIHEYEEDGDYIVTLTITDDDGGVGTDTLTVTVYDFHWLPPLSKKDEFKAGRTIPIKFSLFKNGAFIRDESVQVTVTDSEGNVVFSAIYGEGDDHVRINDYEKYYITNWHTDKKMRGDYTITVSFENGLSVQKTIELVGK